MKITYNKPTLADLDSIYDIELKCFDITQVVKKELFSASIENIPDSFIVARDENNNPIGFILGPSSPQPYLIDKYFEKSIPNSENDNYFCLIGLAVHPNFRKLKIGKELLEKFLDMAKKKNKLGVALTCEENLIKYYEKYGFKCKGISNSKYAGITWYDMIYEF